MIPPRHGNDSLNNWRDSVEPTDDTPTLRQPGIWKGQIWIAPDFDDTDEDLIRLFEGDDDGEDWSDVAPRRS